MDNECYERMEQNKRLVPNNVISISVIQEGQMYTLEDAKFKDTGDILDEDEIEFINEIHNYDRDIWLNESGSYHIPQVYVHFK